MPDWLLTYDDRPLIRSAYELANVKDLNVRYSLQSTRAAGELFITPHFCANFGCHNDNG